MAMGPERSKPLHNFSMPCLKWGSQRFLRCVKVTTEPSPSPSPSPLDRRSSSRRFQAKNQIDNPFHNSKRKANHIDIDIDNLNNIDAVREKLMIDLRVAANNLKVSIFEERVAPDDDAAAAANPRPWNLRTRRAACKAPHREEQRNLDSGSSPRKVGEAVVAKEKENPKSAEKNQKMMNERGKFSVSLSKEEVEQDFWALVGTRPPRRPKKRPRIVQKQLDPLFPGLWLTEVTAESYKVPDVPE